MKYFIIALVIIIIVILIILFIIAPMKNQNDWANNIKAFLKEKNINFTLDKVSNQPYQYELLIDEKSYLIKLLNIPSYAEVQINNNITWEIKYGAGNTPGKMQPYKKYANNVASFVNLETNDKLKVVVLIPNAKKITKYINECEIIIVKPTTNVYGLRMINGSDYSLFIKEGE